MPTQSRCSQLSVISAVHQNPSHLTSPVSGPQRHPNPKPQPPSVRNPRRRRRHSSLRAGRLKSSPYGPQPRQIPLQHIPLHRQPRLRLLSPSHNHNRRFHIRRPNRHGYRRRYGKHDEELRLESRAYTALARAKREPYEGCKGLYHADGHYE